MKYESFIRQIIRYNPPLRKKIVNETYMGIPDEPEVILNWIRTNDGLDEISIPLGSKENKERVFERLFEILWNDISGKQTNLRIVKRSLKDDDLIILFDEKFIKNLIDKLRLRTDTDDEKALGRLFDMKEIKDELIEHDLISEGDKITNLHLIALLLENKSTLLSESFIEDIWVYLSDFINLEAEEELCKKNNLDCEPQEVLKQLVLTTIDFDSREGPDQTKDDGSQEFDTIAVTILKSEINGIIETYKYHANEVTKGLIQKIDDDLSSIIYSSFQYYVSNSFRRAINKFLLSNARQFNNVLSNYLPGNQNMDGSQWKEVDIKLIQFFILSGLEVPDPFSFKKISDYKFEAPKYEAEAEFDLTSKGVVETVKEKYEEEYGSDGYESISFNDRTNT